MPQLHLPCLSHTTSGSLLMLEKMACLNEEQRHDFMASGELALEPAACMEKVLEQKCTSRLGAHLQTTP